MNTNVCAPEDTDKISIKKLQMSIVKVCRGINQLHNRLIRGNEEALSCLSCMTGNCHVQFLGGLASATRLAYLVMDAYGFFGLGKPAVDQIKNS